MTLPLSRWRKIQGDGSTPHSRLDLETWNGLLDELGPLLAGLVRKGADFDAIAETAIGVLLDRVNGVLGPAYDDVLARTGQVEALLAQLNGAGVAAGAVLETPERRFVSDLVLADLQARLTAAAADAAYARLDGANGGLLTASFGGGLYTVDALGTGPLVTGRPFRVRFTTPNPATPVSIAFAQSSPHRIRRFLGGVETDLLAGDIQVGVSDLVYDGTAHGGAGAFVLLNPRARPAFGADKGGVDQTGISPSTLTKITFGSELYDVGGLYDPATGRVQPSFPCRLRLGAKLLTTAGNVAGGSAVVAIMRNGTAVDSDTNRIVNTNAQTVRGEATVEFNGSTDYAEIFLSMSGTGDKTVSGTPNQTSCWGFMV